MRLLGVVAALAALVSMGPAAFVWLFGRGLLYHPTGVGEAQLGALAGAPGWMGDSVSISEGAGAVVLRGLVRPGDPGAPWLLYFGGNAMSIDTIQTVLGLVGGEGGLGLAVYSYRGYDASTGRPSQGALLADARRLAGHLEARFGVGPERLIPVGQSLGTGVASHLAATLSDEGAPPRALILLSPYTSMAAVFDGQVPVLPVGFAVRDAYRTEALADRVRCPALLIHGAEDRLIPADHSRALARGLGGGAELVILEGREHNDLWADPRTVGAIQGFIGARAPAADGP